MRGTHDNNAVMLYTIYSVRVGDLWVVSRDLKRIHQYKIYELRKLSGVLLFAAQHVRRGERNLLLCYLFVMFFINACDAKTDSKGS